MLESLAFRNVPSRPANLLGELSQNYGEPSSGGFRIRLRLTHQNLADIVGSNRETMSQQSGKGGEEILKEFSQLRGNAFAKRYAENELGYHKLVVKTIDETFIPTTKNEELKALLRGANKTFKVHQGHAETMNAHAQKL